MGAVTLNPMQEELMITDAGGRPVHGNQRAVYDSGCRFDFDNPEHR